MLLLISGSTLQVLVQEITIFNALMTIKAKKEKWWLRFVVIDVHSIWKAFRVGLPHKNDRILSLRYNLQRSIMLFYEAEIFSFSKNINSIGLFSWSPYLFHYCILYVKEKYW